MNILDQIIDRCQQDLVKEKLMHPEKETISQAKQALYKCRDFFAAFVQPEQVRVIAELKKASPSKGLIRPDFKPKELCLELEANGAAALSVLTEKNYFRGDQEYLQQASQLVCIPVLRKDFIFEPYQVYRSRVLGADAILLIAAALDHDTFASLYQLARELGMQVLCEVHNPEELEMVLKVDVDIIGINSRNLKTFKTDLNVTRQMMSMIPDSKVKIAESGINSADDIKNMIAAGASGFLIGESLMRETHPGQKLAELIERGRA